MIDYDAAAEASAREAESVLAEAFAALGIYLTAEIVAEMIRTGAATSFFDTLAWTDLPAGIQDIYAPGGALYRSVSAAIEEAIRNPPPGVRIDVDAEAVAESAREVMAARGSLQASRIIESNRRAIVMLARRAAAGSAAAAIALQLGLVGLDEPRLRSLVDFGDSLIEQGASVEDARAQMRNAYARLLAERLRVIQEQEARMAVSEGLLATWQAAADAGQLDPALYELVWEYTSANPCVRCLALNGRSRPLRGGVFVGRPVEGGGRFAGTSEQAPFPPLHPWCKCRLVLRKKKIPNF